LKQEKASIDEAFIDFTRPVKEKLLERYPHLAQAPADTPNGTDSPLPPPPPIHWDNLGTVVLPEGTDSAGEKSDFEADGGPTWHDVALSIAAELMRKIREDIHSKLGYTTSAVSAISSLSVSL
jgi:DNA polymerase eta